MEENIIGELIVGYGLVTVLLAGVFFIVYLPLEFFTRKSKKFIRGLILLLIAFGCFIGPSFIFQSDDAWIVLKSLSLMFGVMGILSFIKEKISMRAHD
ncbi:MAG: hypothetical protein WCW30_05180 [Candidatus Gracilibacteria bacterium]|jgi:hypothetical protein